MKQPPRKNPTTLPSGAAAASHSPSMIAQPTPIIAPSPMVKKWRARKVPCSRPGASKAILAELGVDMVSRKKAKTLVIRTQPAFTVSPGTNDSCSSASASEVVLRSQQAAAWAAENALSSANYPIESTVLHCDRSRSPIPQCLEIKLEPYEHMCDSPRHYIC